MLLIFHISCSATFELPQADEIAKKKAGIICHMCQEMGHKSFQCPKNPEVQEQLARAGLNHHESRSAGGAADNEQENQKPPEFHGRFGGSGGPRFSNDHQQQGGFQPYQFHPRPQFYQRRNNDRPEGEQQQPRRALEDVVCYKVSVKYIIFWR